MDNPIISLIIPVFNTAHYLSECLESVKKQTFISWECILIDDGSSDESGKICDIFAHDDNRFSVIHQENGGVSSARNSGLNIVRGSYVAFADADDVLLPEALDLLYQNQQESGADIVCADAWRWEGDAKTLLLRNRNVIYYDNVLSKVKHFALWAQLFNINIIRRYNLKFNEYLAFSEDAVFVSEFAIHANAIKFLTDPIYCYRINPLSVNRSVDKKLISLNQFRAAKEFSYLRNKYSETSIENLRFLKEQEHVRMKWGINAYFNKNATFSLSTLFYNYKLLYPRWEDSLWFIYLFVFRLLSCVKKKFLYG